MSLLKPEGRKDDTGKPRWRLLRQGCALALLAVIRVLMYGAKKYGDNNWQDVANADERYRDALDRHLSDLDQGIEYDADTGEHNYAHVATNALFLLELALRAKVVKQEQPQCIPAAPWDVKSRAVPSRPAPSMPLPYVRPPTEFTVYGFSNPRDIELLSTYQKVNALREIVWLLKTDASIQAQHNAGHVSLIRKIRALYGIKEGHFFDTHQTDPKRFIQVLEERINEMSQGMRDALKPL